MLASILRQLLRRGAGRSPENPPAGTRGPRGAAAGWMEEALQLQRDGRYGELIARCEAILRRKPEDVDAWAAFLEDHGVTIDAKPRTHRDGARSCYFKDPDGNTVQIIHHPPISDKA